MALSVDTPRTFVECLNGGYVVDAPVGASETIYKGSAVSLDAGDQYVAPLAAGEVFLGIALEAATGTAANGGATVKVQVGGVVQLAVGSVAQANVGAMAYASADGTFTLVSTSNSGIGRIIHVPASGTAWVMLKVPGDTMVQAASAS